MSGTAPKRKERRAGPMGAAKLPAWRDLGDANILTPSWMQDEEAAEGRIRNVLARQDRLVHALARYADPGEGHWRLLNADRDELRAIAQEHGVPEYEAADFVAMLDALREMYRMLASGEAVTLWHRWTMPVDGDECEWEKWEKALTERDKARLHDRDRCGDVQRRFMEAQQRVAEIAKRCKWLYEDHWYPGPTGFRREWNRVFPDEKEGPSLFVALVEPLNHLLDGLQSDTESTVFVCEWCAKIGPANRKSRRFCDDRCRRAFNYRKGLDAMSGKC